MVTDNKKLNSDKVEENIETLSQQFRNQSVQQGVNNQFEVGNFIVSEVLSSDDIVNAEKVSILTDITGFEETDVINMLSKTGRETRGIVSQFNNLPDFVLQDLTEILIKTYLSEDFTDLMDEFDSIIIGYIHGVFTKTQAQNRLIAKGRNPEILKNFKQIASQRARYRKNDTARFIEQEQQKLIDLGNE